MEHSSFLHSFSQTSIDLIIGLKEFPSSLNSYSTLSGISEYESIKAILEDLKSNLPTVEETENEMEEKLK